MGSDPNPLATGPTKWRAERCVTHHHACDCREWEHACEIESLRSRLAAANALLRDEAALLRAWARESREGGWSTHQYDPMLRRANELDTHLQGAGDEA